MQRKKTMVRGITLAVALAALIGGVMAWKQLRSSEPLYAMVSFGPDEDDRLGFVARGLDLFVDRNLDDGIQPVEHLGSARARIPGQFTGADGETVYQNISFDLLLIPHAVNEQRPQELLVNADVESGQPFSLSAAIEMVSDPEASGTLQIDKPYSIRTQDRGIPGRLIAGGGDKEFRVAVGRTGENPFTEVFVSSSSRTDGSLYAFSKGVGPEVEIEFPSETAGEPIIKRFVLDGFC